MLTFVGMTNFVAIFPLNIVVYPGEPLHLHIFEPRYKQLIQECITDKKPFGIPTVLEKGVSEWGTLMEITEVSKVYEDGKMDIKTRGIKIFRILEVVADIPDKQYSGAIVNYPPNDEQQRPAAMQKVLAEVRRLHDMLNVTKDFKKADDALLSYDVAHHAGLSFTQEYELLCLLREDQRLEYLKRHLKKTLPVASGLESLKERIKLNGHFKELKGFNF